MDKEIKEALKQFDEVWERVGSGSVVPEREKPGADGGEPAAIRHFIDETAQMCHTLRSIARSVGTPSRRQVLELRERERARLIRLKTEYFLITGRQYRPGEACPAGCKAIVALRLCRAEKLLRRERYQRRAQLCADAERAELFAELAREEEEDAARIKGIITSLMRRG